jgi:hypothetical protein
MIQFFINSVRPTTIRGATGLITAGLVLIFLGLLIIFVPEILVAFIAFLFITTGFALFGWGLNIRKLQNQFQQVKINIEE